ncbi:Oidioi.mRNA.OKI2018_I69.chr2.g5821.t1.cds [Oikopleura dioica]|uniref:Oidioi.mRNA.OKI2018_I69.chr2.g5821.t1.cds n=1 Tax=Oikopleura dioica TaxID=34765 RepID=A0ABN7T5W3_OIKDI|nr:Oidioi.mRNA.OKI2018_I69.chr2.g5821.t1.cds [Oikopleura dioica]
MDCLKAVREYILSLIEKSGKDQIKTLILDAETTKIVSMAFSQSDLLKHEVYLFERLDGSARSNMSQVVAIVFVRPTQENFGLLIKELRSPAYKNYHIFFSSTIDRQNLKELAEADSNEVVHTVQEIFADYQPYGAHLYNIPVAKMSSSQIGEIDLRRITDGLMALLLSIRRYPTAIKYSKSSNNCLRVCERLTSNVSRERELFQQAGKNDVTLVILDRRDDAATPLLMQWTYEAMLHEILTLTNNCIDLTGISGVPKELQKIMITADSDDFYANNLYLNFGEIGQNIKKMVEDFTRQKQINQKVDSIQDMKTFVENYPAFKKQSGTVNKHVVLVEELSKRVGRHKLLQVSEVEQNICASDDLAEITQSIRDLIEDKDVNASAILRVVALFALKFGSANEQTLRSLSASACQAKQINRTEFDSNIRGIRDYSSGIQIGESSSEKVLGAAKKLFRGVQGVENIYTQHVPPFRDILENVAKGRPDNRLKSYGPNPQAASSRDVICFIIGGVTYEESFHIYKLNKELAGNSRITIGGSSMLNSRLFLSQIVQSNPSTSPQTV